MAETDTPQPADLRTLAAQAISAYMAGEDLGLHERGYRVEPGNPWAQPNERSMALADAVLAAVLPAHREQVLDEAAQAIERRREWAIKAIGWEVVAGFDEAEGALDRLAATAAGGPAPLGPGHLRQRR